MSEQGTANAFVTLGGFAQQPTAPPAELNARIDQVENGFIVRVGCKTFVAEDFKRVAEGLELYFKNPTEAQKKYCKQ